MIDPRTLPLTPESALRKADRFANALVTSKPAMIDDARIVSEEVILELIPFLQGLATGDRMMPDTALARKVAELWEENLKLEKAALDVKGEAMTSQSNHAYAVRQRDELQAIVDRQNAIIGRLVTELEGKS